MTRARHLSLVELEAALDDIRQAPRDTGVVRMIVRRPRVEDREVLEVAELDERELEPKRLS